MQTYDNVNLNLIFNIFFLRRIYRHPIGKHDLLHDGTCYRTLAISCENGNAIFLLIT